jgi:hypothetical protein
VKQNASARSRFFAMLHRNAPNPAVRAAHRNIPRPPFAASDDEVPAYSDGLFRIPQRGYGLDADLWSRRPDRGCRFTVSPTAHDPSRHVAARRQFGRYRSEALIREPRLQNWISQLALWICAARSAALAPMSHDRTLPASCWRSVWHFGRTSNSIFAVRDETDELDHCYLAPGVPTGAFLSETP